MNQEKINAMRKGGKILGEILRDLKDHVKPGMTKKELDAWVRQEIVKRGATPSYDEIDNPPFPGCICICINDELVHGAPNKDDALEPGDKVSFDLVIKYQGYHTDACFSMLVPNADGSEAHNPAVKNLIKATEQALWAGIDQVGPGVRLGTIGRAVETVLDKNHLGVVENYVGHGIGAEMHQKPEVPNYGRPGKGYELQPGDCICIEPMSSLGKAKNYVSDDGWTVKLKDGSVACHCEHTILVTEDGHEVLTLPNVPRP